MAPAKKERRATFQVIKEVYNDYQYKVLLHLHATRHHVYHNFVVLKMNTLSDTKTLKITTSIPPHPLVKSITLFCQLIVTFSRLIFGTTVIKLTYSVSKGVIQDPLGSIFGILRESWIIQELREQKKGQNLWKISLVHQLEFECEFLQACLTW